MKKLKQFLVAILLLLFYNEFLVYYIILSQCRWPDLNKYGNENDLKIMLLADIHLLGSREGHWFDKLRREWQIERSFQTSIMVHKPDVVFILGDLLDEGKWCSNSEFKYHAERFYQKFSLPSQTQLFVLAGNHDMGFHYMIDSIKQARFEKYFSSPLVRMVTIRGNIFVLLNSMAFERDGCSMCKEAELRINEMYDSLLCAQGLNVPSCTNPIMNYSRPILLQHFPLFRQSDWNCTGPDSAPEEEKFILMRPKWDCLDKGISQELLSKLKPRAVFSGHTHHFCLTRHGNVPEWNVPSFSWRYKKLSSFIMMTLNSTSIEVSKCYLPNETTVIHTYLVGIPLIIVVVFFPHKRLLPLRRVKIT